MTTKKKLIANFYDLKATKLDSISLDPAFFDLKDNPDLIAQSVRVYLSNQRRAKAKVKNRSEVRGTTRKVWKQKGTGRARHGDRRAPIFVGGGKAHAPRGDQNFKLKLSKKMNRLARLIVLSHFARNEKIIALKDISSLPEKTKAASDLLKNLGKKEKSISLAKRVALITTPDQSAPRAAFKNIKNVTLISSESLNTYQLSLHPFLIFSKEALDILQTKKNEN